MLCIAKILKSNGIEGGLLVSAPDFDLSEISEPVFIIFDGLPVPFFIEECFPKGVNKYIIRLTDVSNLRDAEEMVGREILADVSDADIEDDSIDFTGWKVFDHENYLGEVEGMELIPGNPCLYVVQSSSFDPIMIPLHEDFIIKVDPEEKELYLNLPDGLY